MKFEQGEFKPTNGKKWFITTTSLGGANITYRSSFELKFYKWCDCSPIVKFVSVEPFAIPYIGCDGKAHKYYPDALLKMINDMKILVEIKPYDKVVGNVKKNFDYYRNRLKWKACKQMCEKFDMKFLIITEKELNSDMNALFTKYMNLEKNNGK